MIAWVYALVLRSVCVLCIVRNVNGTYATLQESIYPAMSLRVQMMVHGVTVVEVCQLIERNRCTVSRYRQGQTPIPPDIARKLHAAGLLDKHALSIIEAAS